MLRSLSHRLGGRSPAELVATRPRIRRGADPSLRIFCNPFGATIMSQVRDRLAEALDQVAEAVTVIYANPEHDAVFRGNSWWIGG